MTSLQSFAKDLSEYIIWLMSKDNGSKFSELSGYLHSCNCYYNLSLGDEYWDSMCRICVFLGRDHGVLPVHIHSRMLLSNNSWCVEYLKCLKT